MHRLTKITAALALGLFIANAGTEAKAQWGGGPGHGGGHGPGHGGGHGGWNHHGGGWNHHGGGWGHGGGHGHHGGGWGRGMVGPVFPPVMARYPVPAAYFGYPVGRVIYYGGVNYRILPYGVMTPYY